MNIYLLKRKADRAGYDVANGFVVRANTAKKARLLASREAGDEGDIKWIRPKYSSLECIGECSSTMNEAVILRDFNAA